MGDTMNDQNIKDMIQSDLSSPKKSINEWRRILAVIESKKSHPFRLLIPTFAVLMLFVVGGYQGQKNYQEKQEQQIAEYLIESGEIFEEEDQLYAWID